jgi:outer membrane protein assembly factor BamB
MKTPAIVALLLVAAAASPSRGEDWPAWRGPRGDGTSRETEVPLSWSATENIAWRTAVPGTGRSSPVVVDTRVFLTTAEAADESRRLLCFDRERGTLLWNTVVHQGAAGVMHRLNSPASSTPVGDAERVYAVFVDDQGMRVVAADLSGAVVWSASPGSFQSQHGFAAGPLLFGEGLIVNGQQDGEAFVVMLHRATGAELWRYRPQVNLRSFSTPLVIQHDGDDQLILAGASQTVALAPLTGKLLWFADGPSQKFVSTPAVGHGLVFSFGGSPEKRAMAIRLGGSGDVSDTHVVWRNERAMPYVPSPLLVGEYLHVISDAGIYTCLDPRSGETLSTGRKLGPVSSSPVAVAGRVYLFEDSGKCTVIRNGPAFDVLATNEIGEPVYSTPAITAASLFVRTEAHLIRIRAPAD